MTILKKVCLVVCQRDLGADAVTVRSCANRLHPKHVVLVAVVVAQQRRGPLVVRDNNIEVTIVVEVESTAAPRPTIGFCKAGPTLADSLFELVVSIVAKQQRRLGVLESSVAPC